MPLGALRVPPAVDVKHVPSAPFATTGQIETVLVTALVTCAYPDATTTKYGDENVPLPVVDAHVPSVPLGLVMGHMLTVLPLHAYR